MIKGTVSDASSGSPLAGASVSLYLKSGSLVTSKHTAADGSYLFSQLPAGQYKVAFADGGKQCRARVLLQRITQPRCPLERHALLPSAAESAPDGLDRWRSVAVALQGLIDLLR